MAVLALHANDTAALWRWEARLAREGMPREPADDRPNHRAHVVPLHRLEPTADHLRRPISIVHEKLSAAVWRFPFRAVRANQHTLSAARQRAAVRMLAGGATVRQVMKRLRMGPWTVVELRRMVLAWDDPEDRED